MSDEVIETREQLLAYIAAHEDQSDQQLISGLGDMLLSDTVSLEEPWTWRKDVNWLHRCIDWRDENCRCDRSTWPDPSED